MPVHKICLCLMLITLSYGCAVGTSPNLNPRPCTSLACMTSEASAQVFRQCSQDLFWYERSSRQEKKAINQRYRYPMTSTESYFDLTRLGFRGPTPEEWCKAFAQAYVGS